MPELPEVERVGRTVAPSVVGRVLQRVELKRRDVVEGDASPRALLADAEIASVRRHGKQLALVACDGRCLVVQLGMTGQLLVTTEAELARLTHMHVSWTIGGTTAAVGASDVRLVFRDPRRFGGLTPCATIEVLEARWASLGPDALTIEPSELAAGLAGSRRPIKSALLDQNVLAGVGNIYADEALFGAGLSPRRLAGRLTMVEVARLSRRVREVLSASIEAGGSTLRDFVDGDGKPGTYRDRHQVYGRGGDACMRCGKTLAKAVIAQRTTVWCRGCQR